MKAYFKLKDRVVVRFFGIEVAQGACVVVVGYAKRARAGIRADNKITGESENVLLQLASCAFAHIVNTHHHVAGAAKRVAGTYLIALTQFDGLDVMLLSRLCYETRDLGVNNFFSHGEHENIVAVPMAMLDSHGVLDIRCCILYGLSDELPLLSDLRRLSVNAKPVMHSPCFVG